MVVYRCQEAPIGLLTREKDVFFLGADFDVPGAKLVNTDSIGHIRHKRSQAVTDTYNKDSRHQTLNDHSR